MEFTIKNSNVVEQKSSCIVAGFFEPYCFSNSAERLDKISNGYINTLLQQRGLKGKIGQTLLLHRIPNMLSKQILLIGCGKECDLDEYQYRKIIQKIIDILNDIGSIEVDCFLIELNIKNRDAYWKIRQIVEIGKEMNYEFTQLKTDKNKIYRSLQKLTFNILTDDEEILAIGNRAIHHGLAIAEGIKVTKDLGNMPPNICNAAYLASRARQLENNFSKNTAVHIVDEQQMHNLRMHSYLSVGNSSQNESIMSIIEYKGNLGKDTRPIVLVGKGMTFDSGGISIKSSEGMDEMKYDMCGAAAVYGVMQVVNELQLPLNIIGILAGCENMPGKYAYRPGDILTTMSGQTVEVINTDAEGRLVLCDVLTYVERFNPKVVIDIATLTGACITALGHHMTGLMSNHNPLANELIIASEQSCDRAWHLPLNNEFQEQIESNFADIANTGGKPGGVITAGCFLSRFTHKYHWAHLDIAGTAWRSGRNKGATGRPVAMLSQFLLNLAELINNVH